MSSTQENTHWPRKTCELRNHTLDSTRWNDFHYRDDDLVIATWAKSGTTWLQQIILQLIHNGAEPTAAYDDVAWIEQRALPKPPLFRALEARTGRRVLKTHLPVPALVFSPRASYFYVGRDGRDALWSWYNHHRNMTPPVYDLINGTPGRIGPPLRRPSDDIREYFHEWLHKDGFPLWPFWSHVQSWWEIRHLPNVLLTHFRRLKTDLRGEIARIARFLNLEVDAAAWPRILEQCSFDYMRRNASALSSSLNQAFVGGAKTFLNRGTNGQWTSVLTADDIRQYEDAARLHLTPDCAEWLATGVMDRESCSFSPSAR